MMIRLFIFIYVNFIIYLRTGIRRGFKSKITYKYYSTYTQAETVGKGQIED